MPPLSWNREETKWFQLINTEITEAGSQHLQIASGSLRVKGTLAVLSRPVKHAGNTQGSTSSAKPPLLDGTWFSWIARNPFWRLFFIIPRLCGLAVNTYYVYFYLESTFFFLSDSKGTLVLFSCARVRRKSLWAIAVLRTQVGEEKDLRESRRARPAGWIGLSWLWAEGIYDAFLLDSTLTGEVKNVALEAWG